MKLLLFVFACVLCLTGCQTETPPTHPETGNRKIFDVRAFGAVGDGLHLDTAAIQAALDACDKAGGGVAKIPAGTYLSKPIQLHSGTTLQLDAGAVLQARDEPADFLDANGATMAFVNGKNLTNVVISGRGTIDGAGARWWAPARTAKLTAQPETVRRPRLVALTGCKDVRVENVTLQNSPSFHLVPTDCEDVVITNVTIQAPADSPNTDAIDPSCRNLLITHCRLDVGDDNVAIKAGHKIAGREFQNENITVTDCTFLRGHGMSIGSETRGGVKNLLVKNCTFDGTTSGIRIKTSRERGGTVEGVVYRDLTMTNVEMPINITCYYPKIPATDSAQPVTADTPVYRDIQIINLTASGPKSAGFIVGLPELCVSNVVFENVKLSAETGLTIRNAKGIRFANSSVVVKRGASFTAENADVEGLANIGRKIKIVLVGDSTVQDSSGWGLGFRQFLDTNQVDLINTARGGRSSLSFMREGRWTNALALKGDYYLIQFGHNNEPGKPGRSTDMATFVTNMTEYVDDSLAIGAKPILVTPLTRRQWDKENPGKIKSSLAPYADEVRKIASAKNIPLVDLQARSIELCESLGREKCYEFSPVKTVDGTNTFDGTHLKPNGSVMFARLVADELRKNAPELAPVLRDEPMDANPVFYNAVLYEDGSGTQTNLQAAINAAPDDGTNLFSILIHPGTYQGQFIVPKTKRHLKFVGEDLQHTILTYSLNQNESPSPDGRPIYNNAGTVILGDDFHVENITFQNTSGDHGQALALRADGDREIFNHCRLLGWQDTLLVNTGRDYFTNCYIEGRVDFIYGSAAAVFDRCEIHSKNGGHVTAANTPKDKPFGFVFMDCDLTGDPQPWISSEGLPANTNSPPQADLGRPWRPYASVTYLNCEMGDHIKPEGWNNWRNPTNELTARYAEYNSTGPGANPDKRFKWTRQLTKGEAEKITIESVLGGSDGWNPAARP